MSKKNLFPMFCASASLLALTAVASAVQIIPGQSFPAVPELAPGGTLVDSQTQPFATANYNGDLVSKVFKNDPTSPLGGYTFTYQFNNALGGSNALTRLTVNGFSSYSTDVSYQLGTGDVAPTQSTRDPFGNVIGYTFVGDGAGFIMPGQNSMLLVVQTNAQSYRTQIASIINGAASSVNAFAPSGAITPEPALLAGTVAAGLAFARRRRA